MRVLKRRRVLTCCIGVCAVVAGLNGSAQLAVQYGSEGLQSVSYAGTTLEDTTRYPADRLHIWHMKVTDLQGNVLTGPADGWGENSPNKSWNAATHTWTYGFAWGSLAVQFVQSGDALNLVVTETNRAGSGVVLNGAAIYPLALHFPSLPAGFLNAAYPQIAFNTTAPSATLANFGTAEVAAIVPDAARPLYSGFWPTGDGTPTYSVLVSSTVPDGLATFQPHNDRPVQPGQTDTFTTSLRFAPSGTTLRTLATDAYASWSNTWPAQLQWTDKRIIGTAYLATSPTGSDVTQPGGFPNNPRRYFNDGNSSDFDIRTPAGLALFQTKVLQQARDIVTNLQRLNAQGVITWDLEGQQFPQDTSYVCSPDQIGSVAPEMESVVTVSGSPYAGQKLDDAYFKTITSAGFRVGVCIRPQRFTMAANGTAQQVYLSDSDAEAAMKQKIQYAHDRWGATLFYIDSTVEANGMVLDAGIFQRIAAAFSDSLLIPEESTPKHYAYTAPFKTFIFHQDLGTDASVHAYYPKAFSCNLINDVDPALLTAFTAELTASVAAGDILMTHADYWQANNPAIVAIYQAAGVTTPATPVTTAPVPTTPVTITPDPALPITWKLAINTPMANSTISGLIQVVADISTTLDAAGSYLMVDGQEVGTARVTTAPYLYALDTTTLSAGQHTLQLWGHNTVNEVLLSNAVPVTVSNTTVAPANPVTTAPVPTSPVITVPVSYPVGSAPVTITYPQGGQAIQGSVLVSATILPALDAAGSYLMVDEQPYGYQRLGSPPYVFMLDASALGTGAHTLRVWAHTTGNDTLLSDPITVTVAR